MALSFFGGRENIILNLILSYLLIRVFSYNVCRKSIIWRNLVVFYEKNNELDLDIGSRHFVIQRRYEALGVINDLLIAIWFLIGSIFFLNDSLMQSGTWLFIVGSAQFLIKPLIKLASLIHVSRIYKEEQKNIKIKY